MKKLIIVMMMPILISATSMAQTAPSLSAFTNANQRSQLAAYATWAAKVEAKKAADSIGAIYENRIRYLESEIENTFEVSKSLGDSLINYSNYNKAMLDTISALRIRINGVNTAVWSNMNGVRNDLGNYIASNDIRVGSLEQSRTTLTDRVIKVETAAEILKSRVDNIQPGITDTQLKAITDDIAAMKLKLVNWVASLKL